MYVSAPTLTPRSDRRARPPSTPRADPTPPPGRSPHRRAGPFLGPPQDPVDRPAPRRDNPRRRRADGFVV